MLDKNKYVLVVDDFATMRRIVIACLKSSGFTNILEAEDGVKGLTLAKTIGDNITLVVSDWNMPNMSGIELLKAMKSDPKLRHIPVMMVTAEAKKENIIEAAQSGASSYIIKPFSPDTFAEKLKKLQSSLQSR